MELLLNIFIDVLILTFSLIGMFTSSLILFLIFYYRHQYLINTSTLLFCNTYLPIFFTCLALFDMFIYNLYGIIHPNISFDNAWCYTRAYLLHVGLCLIYYSYLLQACFRFFRISFSRNQNLQSIRFMFQFILIQWLIAFILIIPNLIFKNFQYASQAYHCLILYPNLIGLLSTTSIIFYCPMIAIISIYFYILFYIHRKSNGGFPQKRQRSTERDMIVLRRIVILVGMLLIISLPAIFLWIIYIITGDLYPFTYQLQWLTFAFSLAILSIVSIFLTPQLQELVFEPNRLIEHNRQSVSFATQICELRTTDV